MANYVIVCAGWGGDSHAQCRITDLHDGVFKARGRQRAIAGPDGKFELRCNICRLTVRISADSARQMAALFDANPGLATTREVPERHLDQHKEPFPAITLILLRDLCNRMDKVRRAVAHGG